jgi:hypothetical protein
MKRVLTAALAAAMCLGVSACASGGGEIKTGLGVVTSVGSSTPASADAAGRAQVDSIIAVISLDKDGKITKCSLDAAQTRVAFDASGAVTSDKGAAVQTKFERKDDYGMRGSSGIGKEWYEQAEAFSKWAVGKTVADVKGLKTKKVNDDHPHVPDVPELTSSVTIDAGEFIEAIVKASDNAVAAKTGAGYKTGMGVETGIGSSEDATAEAAGAGQVDSYIAAVTVDKDGKIVACSLDTAQTAVNFDASGVITSDLGAEVKSKVEKKDEYGMRRASGIGKEWFEQAEAFSKWCIGKTVSEVKGMKTKAVNENHLNVPDVPELASSVTIDAGNFILAVEKAVANAK